MLEQPVRLVDAPAEFYLWPDLLPAWNAFFELRTQWRHGFNGATGLDYTAVTQHLQRRMRLRGAAFDDMYDAVLCLEDGALQGFFEKQQEDEAKRKGEQPP